MWAVDEEDMHVTDSAGEPLFRAYTEVERLAAALEDRARLPKR